VKYIRNFVSPGVGGGQLTVAFLLNRNCASKFITEIIFIEQLQFYACNQHITRVCYSLPHHTRLFTALSSPANAVIVKGAGAAGDMGALVPQC